jgi:hemerythrin-like domain-containing protein
MPIQIGQRPDHGFDEPLGLLSDCHRRIEHFLQVLTTIAERNADGSPTPAERTQLESSLAYFAAASPKHTADEEESLFPRLRRSNDPVAIAALEALARLEGDHEKASQHHHVVDTLVRRWLAAGRLSPTDAGELHQRLVALQALYRQHIAMEDDEIFPAAGRVLSPDQLHDIGREMAARRSSKNT